MEIIKISLGGDFAHFGINGANDKNNRYSFSHIPGSTLKGLLGAIAGYNGWNQLNKKEKIPEFLEKLKNISYGIVPLKYKFNSIIHTYNNTTGVNKNDNGSSNLQIREEVLENVGWDIYLINVPEDLKKNLLEGKSKYPICLGKRGYFVNKFHVELIEGENIVSNRIDSIFPMEYFQEEEEEDIGDFFKDESIDNYNQYIFLYNEDFFKETKSYVLSKASLKDSIKAVKVKDQNIFMIGGTL
ncbi:CRISPR-associated protein Cas5 [Cetobacterium ceti]